MNDKTLDMLQQLASKLGQTVDYLWPHAVRYVVVDGILGIIVFTALLVATVVGARWAWKQATDSITDDDVGRALVKLGIGLVMVIAVPAFVFGVANAVLQVIEPVGYLVAKAMAGVPK